MTPLQAKLEVRRLSLIQAQHRMDRQRLIIEGALRSLRMGVAEVEVRGVLEAKKIKVGRDTTTATGRWRPGGSDETTNDTDSIPGRPHEQ